jgi:sensor histidine kinase regulating citrate/malate metabolism
MSPIYNQAIEHASSIGVQLKEIKDQMNFMFLSGIVVICFLMLLLGAWFYFCGIEQALRRAKEKMKREDR